jgi:hypothetical protein
MRIIDGTGNKDALRGLRLHEGNQKNKDGA